MNLQLMVKISLRTPVQEMVNAVSSSSYSALLTSLTQLEVQL